MGGSHEALADFPQRYTMGGSYEASQIFHNARQAGACRDELLRFAAARHDIRQDKYPEDVGDWILWYAKNVVQGRWAEVEPIILSNPRWTCDYAMSIIERRWPEGEPIIATNPEWAFYYALDVVKGR